MVGPGGPTWPAGLGLCHLATDLLWMASDPSWTSVLRVSSSDSSILGRAARRRSGGLVPGPLGPPFRRRCTSTLHTTSGLGVFLI